MGPFYTELCTVLYTRNPPFSGLAYNLHEKVLRYYHKPDAPYRASALSEPEVQTSGGGSRSVSLTRRKPWDTAGVVGQEWGDECGDFGQSLDLRACAGRSYRSAQSRSPRFRMTETQMPPLVGGICDTVRMQRSVQHRKTIFLLSTPASTRNPPFFGFCVHSNFRRMSYDVRTDALYRASVVSQEDGRNPRHTARLFLGSIGAQALKLQEPSVKATIRK